MQKLRRSFNQVDKIREELTQNGVVIDDDETQTWRADGTKSSLMQATSTNNAKSTNKFPKMSDFNTFDEAIQTYYDNLDKVSPRNISSFWAAVPKLLKYCQNRGHLATQLETHIQQNSNEYWQLWTTGLGNHSTCICKNYPDA